MEPLHPTKSGRTLEIGPKNGLVSEPDFPAQKRAHFLPWFFVFVDVFGARAVGFGFAEWVELSQDELLDSGCSGCWSAFAE